MSNPSGVFSSSTMIVMRIAITPSLNASSRPLFIPGLHLISSRVNHTSRWTTSKGDRNGHSLVSVVTRRSRASRCRLGRRNRLHVAPPDAGDRRLRTDRRSNHAEPREEGDDRVFWRDGRHDRPDRDLSVLAFYRRVRSRSQPQSCRHGVRDRRRLRSPGRDHRRIRDWPFIEEDARVDGTDCRKRPRLRRPG